MRHCVFDFVDDFQAGSVAVASVRRLTDDRRVATLMLWRGDTSWSVAQIAGFANAPVAVNVQIREP